MFALKNMLCVLIAFAGLSAVDWIVPQGVSAAVTSASQGTTNPNELVQLAKLRMAQDYRGYKVTGATLRSNMLSVSVQTVNPAGRKVNFSVNITAVNTRGKIVYYVGQAIPN